MARNAVPSPPTVDPPYLRPWTVLIVGLGLVLIGLMLCALEKNHTASILRAFCVVIGLFVTGAAIGRRLQTAGQNLEERLETAGMVAGGMFAGLLAYLSIKPDDDWGSAQFFLVGVITVAMFGAVLVLLPATLRKAAASLWLLFHFIGIFVACVNIAPPGMASPPWVTEQAWTRVYRYYLGYLNMTNAYHFYSPDPAPSTLAWFRVQYADDTFQWIEMPSKKNNLPPLAYTRSGVLGSSTDLGDQRPTPLLFNLRIAERKEKGLHFAPEPTRDGQKFQEVPIPIIVEDLQKWYNGLPLPPDAYKEPNDFSKLLISSYVRYIAKHYPHPADPSVPVKNVKVYSLINKQAFPSEMANHVDPLSPAYLYPRYLGTYDTEGKLLGKQQQYTARTDPTTGAFVIDPKTGALDINKLDEDKDCDGFLYWTIPILAIPRQSEGLGVEPKLKANNFDTRNYLLLHAGDIRAFDDKLVGHGGPVPPPEPTPKKEGPP